MLGIRTKIKTFLQNLRDRNFLRKLKSQEKELIKNVKSKNLTYLSLAKCADLLNTIKNIEANKIQGLFVETGCALGGSSILISKTKNNGRIFKIFDVFEMIPPPTEDDPQEVHRRYEAILSGKSGGIGGDIYYGYQENLYELVQNNFRRFGVSLESENVCLIKGLVQDTLKISEPVAFAHIDVDWYEPVKHCLEQIAPNLSVGGSVILDDYFDWGGCRKAANEFLRRVVGQFEMDGSSGAMKLTRIK